MGRERRRRPLPADPVAPGTHRVVARTIAGHEVETTVTVPGAGVDVVVPGARKRRRTAA